MLSYVLFLGLIILSVADYWTTFIILSKGGVEKNPMVNFFIKRWGIKLGVIYAKALPLFAMGILVWADPDLTRDFLIVLVGLYIWVVIHNFKEM